MKLLRIILLLLVAASAIAFLALLIQRSQVADLDRHNERVAQLQILEQLDAEFDAEIAKARLYLDSDSDALLQLIERVQQAHAGLTADRLALRGLNPVIDADIERYLAALQEKIVLARDYESQNLRLINALEILPNEANALRGVALSQTPAAPGVPSSAPSNAAGSESRQPPAPMRLVEAMRNRILLLEKEVMVYGVLPRANNAPVVAALALEMTENIREVSDDDRRDVLRLATLANNVLSAKTAVQELLQRLLGSNTRKDLNALQVSYEARHQSQLRAANRYRQILVIYAASLLLLLGLLGLRLRRSYRQLDRANEALRENNENLEAIVNTRTQDLKNAYNELRDSQAALVQSEKMAALGQMVAGVAHEINTPLAYARNNAQTVQEMLGELRSLCAAQQLLADVLAAPSRSAGQLTDALRLVKQVQQTTVAEPLFVDINQLLDDTEFGLAQVADQVSNLKDFSRVDRSRSDLFNVNDGLNTTLKLVQHQFKDRIEVLRVFDEIPQIECAPSQLNQVFLNIITNAAQAIEGAGRITLSTGVEGGQVLVRIKDTGHGMSDAVSARIFEPFFTTKPVGKGTGLGLSISYRIVKDHGGSISVASTPGQGTEFSIQLPLRQDAAGIGGSAA